MGAGLSWVIYLFVLSLDSSSRFWPQNTHAFVWSILLILMSLASNGLLFYWLLSADKTQNIPFMTSIRLNIAGQLLRYLPGRIWGVVYQIANSKGRISASCIARANIELMVFGLVSNIGIALVVLGALAKPIQWQWLALGLLFFIFVAFLFLAGARCLARHFSRYLPSKVGGILVLMTAYPLTPSRFFAIQMVFFLSWILYLLGWQLLSVVFPGFSQTDFAALAVYYTLASAIGVLSFVTPAGLGVREATFLLLASASAGQEAAVFFAIFGRFWLMFGELLWFALVYLPSLWRSDAN